MPVVTSIDINVYSRMLVNLTSSLVSTKQSADVCSLI